jgi:hypothetical protein
MRNKYDDISAMHSEIRDKVARYKRKVKTLVEIEVDYEPHYLNDKVVMLPMHIRVGRIENRNPQLIRLISALELPENCDFAANEVSGNQLLSKEVSACEKVVDEAWRRHLQGRK